MKIFSNGLTLALLSRVVTSKSLVNCKSNEDCDDGVFCTIDTCNVGTGKCLSNPDPTFSQDVEVSVLIDNYESQTYWEIHPTSDSSDVLASGIGHSGTSATYKESISLMCGVSYKFTIFDINGDGFCCNSGNGSYTVTVKGSVVAKGGDFVGEDEKELLLNIFERPTSSLERALTTFNSIMTSWNINTRGGITHFIRNKIQSDKHVKLLEDDVEAVSFSKGKQIPNVNTATRQLKDLWTPITFDDFENDWGNFESGGSDASIVTYHSRGGHSVRLRDGSSPTEASFFHQSNHDVTSFNTLRVHFWFKGLNFDFSQNEHFLLEYSSDGGENWNTIKQWTHFLLNTHQEETVLITRDEVEFSTMARLRFSCSGNENIDQVYIDDIEFAGLTTWTVITFDDFENGWGNFESGGNDAFIVNYHSRGGHSVRLRDGSSPTEASFLHQSNHDVTLFNILRVHFWYKALNLDGIENENFLLDYSSDGGENWNTIKIMTNVPFNNYREETVLINKGDVEFTNTAKIRFRCDGTESNKQVFIDEIEFDGLENIYSNPTAAPSEMTSLPTAAPSEMTSLPTATPTSPAEAGLSITFNENAIPDSIKNSNGKEYVRQKKPFSKGFFSGDRKFSKMTHLGNGEYKFETREGPQDNFTVIIEEKNNYITFRYTSLPEGNLMFHLMAGKLKAIPLDYMITRVRLSNSYLIVEREESWERSSANPLGGFAIFVNSDNEKEDETLVDLWVNNDYLPRPKVENWNREAAFTWLDKFRDTIFDQSTLYLKPTSLEDHYDIIPFVKLLDARNIYLQPQTWRGEYILNHRQIDDINPGMYPNGLDDILELKQSVLTPNNISLRFHTLSAFVGYNDPEFGKSNPSPDLFTWGSMTLTENLGSSQTSCIVVPEPGITIPKIQGKWPSPGVLPLDTNINIFRIGNDWLKANKIIDLGDGTWKLQNIVKGNRGNHQAGEAITGHVTVWNNGFVVDPNKELLNILAERLATLNNDIGLSNANFDGYLIPGPTGRFGCVKFAQLVYENLDHPTSTTTSIGSFPPAWIEYQFPRVKKDLWQRFNTQLGVGLFLESKSRASAGLEDADHLMFRQMASNGRYFSLGGDPLLTGVTLNTLRAHGLTNKIINSIKRYKRASINMSNEQRNKMMKSFKFQRIFNGGHKGADSIWRPEGSKLRKWFALGTDIYTNLWWLGQEHGTITPRFYVQNGMNQQLQVPDDLNESGATHVRVIGRILPRYEAQSNENIDLMTYLNTESLQLSKSNEKDQPLFSHELQSFQVNPNIDLRYKRGVGLWVTGDGCGATLIVRLRSSHGRDYAIPINFTGKRWVEIPNGEQGWRIKNWGWTNKAQKVLNYKKINQIMVGLGHIPKKTTCDVLVEGLTALSEIHETFVNPVITLGENSVNIPGEISTENHFVLDPDGKFTVYDQSWNTVYHKRVETFSLSPAQSTNFRIESTSSSGIWLEVGVQASKKTSPNPDPIPPVVWAGGENGSWIESSNWEGSSIPESTMDVIVASFATVTDGRSDFSTLQVEWGSTVVLNDNEFSNDQSLLIEGSLDYDGELFFSNSIFHLIGSSGPNVKKINVLNSIIKFEDGASFSNMDTRLGFEGKNTCAFTLSQAGFITISADKLDHGSSWSEFTFEIDITRYDSSLVDQLTLLSFSSHHSMYDNENFNPTVRILDKKGRNAEFTFDINTSSFVLHIA